MTADGLPFEDDPAAGAAPGAVPTRQVFTVTQLTAQIRVQIESAYPMVWVEGELSNCREWKNSGHLYFTLKDARAQLAGVMFKSALRYLRFRPEDGMQVVARGRVTVYERKGEYQLMAEHLEPRGVGARQLAFDQLRRRLEAAGLFDAGRKRPLPALPRKIGVVTSLDGAALRDVLTVVRRRFPQAHLVISPTRVQGEGAPREIVGALRRVAGLSGIDVVILTRGGGSAEDLWAFNDEALARAIAAAPVPVISAVGHETDMTISDFVADLRAPTPSAAAELVVARHSALLDRLAQTATRLGGAVRRRIQQRRALVDAARHRPGLASFGTRLALDGRRVDELTHRLAARARAAVARAARQTETTRLRLQTLDPGRRLPRIRQRLEALRAHLDRDIEIAQAARRHRLETLAARLDALSPLGVLARGYAICWDDQHTAAIRTTRDVAVGDAVRVAVRDGELRCDVKEIE